MMIFSQCKKFEQTASRRANLTEQFRYGASWKEQPFKREYRESGMSVTEYHKTEKQWGNVLRTLTRR